MNTKEEILQSEAWWSGANEDADDALNLALDAIRVDDTARCFALLRIAMTKYGWHYHSDAKARRLWDKWDRIRTTLSGTTSAAPLQLDVAVEELYHETYRAVHFDRNRRLRRNMPPSDPAARREVSVPLPIGNNSTHQ
jgi:hypothetical protein